jgi:Mu-like prophage I protein
MTAFATLLTPVDASPAIELGNTWRKRILPVGEIEYQGRQLKFTRSYLQGLVSAWQQRAYDQVPLQFADAANSHTNDPERTRGWITDMEVGPDGLYVTAELTPRGQATLADNPYLGVSARIVEQYQRADGTFFPAAIQQVLGTLDPRIPGLGAWQEVQLASDSAVTIDLSNLSFAGAADGTTLNDRELAELLDVLAEVDAEGDGGDQLSDAELEAMMYEAEHGGGSGYSDAFSEFDSAFNARVQADQDRQDAISAAIVEDTMHPARRDEDKLARIMQRAQDGVYSGQQMAFSSEQSTVELAMTTGHAPCGPPDEWGRCSARWHSLECRHSQSVDWLASGPPRSTYDASLANFLSGIELAAPAAYGDPDGDEPMHQIPARTLQFAASLADELNLREDHWSGPPAMDLLRAPGQPVSVRDELLADMGYELPAQAQPARPGIRELAERMGLR